jgi:hypothetical protein
LDSDTAPVDVAAITMAMATRNNANYQHQVIQKQKNFSQNDPTLWKNNLTEFPEKDIEESSKQLSSAAIFSCYHCDYNTDNKDHDERHIILRHNHCPAYLNKAEIEKRGLKAQGKD